MDIRPVVFVMGFLFVALGAAMLPCAVLDARSGMQPASVFLSTGVVTILFGAALSIATANFGLGSMSVRQAFLLTTSAWFFLPVAGALPLVLGAPGTSFSHAYFEAVSGMTTTGATVIEGLDGLPPGTLMWRSILQWLGGLGIVIVALIFLPVMRVGGMQFFRSEGFDTLGKVLPRARDISFEMFRVYIGLTLLCWAVYFALGMDAFDGLAHSLTTLSSGGFSTRDASFAAFPGATEYASAFFMFVGTVPFIRLVQLVNGSARPFWSDIQIRAYLRWTLYAIAAVVAYRLATREGEVLPILRETTFYVVSIFSGTGYTNADAMTWGAFPMVVLIVVGLIGGCTASTGCSLKIFRWLVVFEVLKTQTRLIHSPRSVVRPKLGRQVLEQDVIDSVIALFSSFILAFGVFIVLLSLTGLSFFTAITAAWTSIANVGPIYGPGVSSSGAIHAFPDSALWIMCVAMVMGRLEVLAVLVLVLPRFWRV